ncbi:MAG: hypothetical protein ACO22I_06165 [Candidatus Nanopelagicales bacterium]
MQILISESDRQGIIRQYDKSNITETYVIKDWLSPDDKYLIFLDELYDLESKKFIGNIWEDFNRLKTFLVHTFEVAKNIPVELKESVDFLNKLVITESKNILEAKLIIQSLINEEENWFTKLSDWMGEKVSGAVQGVKDFAKTSYEGAKKLIGNISQGEWTKVLDLVKKGALYVFRSLRSAMYNPVGLVLDAVLVATGIGKTVQWIPWAMIVALDVWELMTGNYENPNENPYMRILFYCFDVLGLVTTGVIAAAARRAAKMAVAGAKTSQEITAAISKNSYLKGVFETILKGLPKVESLLKQAVTFLKTRFPAGAKFIEGIISGLKKFTQSISNMFSKQVTKQTERLATAPKATTAQTFKTAGKSAALNTGLFYGTEKAYEKGYELYTGRNLEAERLAAQSIQDYLKGRELFSDA